MLNKNNNSKLYFCIHKTDGNMFYLPFELAILSKNYDAINHCMSDLYPFLSAGTGPQQRSPQGISADGNMGNDFCQSFLFLTRLDRPDGEIERNNAAVFSGSQNSLVTSNLD